MKTTNTARTTHFSIGYAANSILYTVLPTKQAAAIIYNKMIDHWCFHKTKNISEMYFSDGYIPERVIQEINRKSNKPLIVRDCSNPKGYVAYPPNRVEFN